MKKICVLLITLSVAAGNVCALAGDFDEITFPDDAIRQGHIYVEKQRNDFDVPTNYVMGDFEHGGPTVDENGTVLLPLRDLAEGFYYTVSEDNNTMYLSIEERTIEVPYEGNTAIIDGSVVDFEHRYMNNDIYFPYMEASMLFDLVVRIEEVNWEWDKDAIYILMTERESTPIAEVDKALRLQALEFQKSLKKRIEEPRDEIEIDYIKSIDELIVTVNEKVIDFGNDRPFIDDNGRTQVPIRYIAESLGCNVAWDGSSQTAVISTDAGKIIKITVGNSILTIDDDIVEMDTEAMITNDRTYVPIRYLGEALDMTVRFSW